MRSAMHSSVVESIARWMGILTTGLLIGSEAEEAAKRAQRVLGSARLSELRGWFDATPAPVVRDAKCAVIEACIAIGKADGSVDASERELLEEMLRLAELDDASSDELRARIDQAPAALDALVARLTQPSLRELVLVMAWQIITADGVTAADEERAYEALAAQLEIEPARALELRTILRDSEGASDAGLSGEG